MPIDNKPTSELFYQRQQYRQGGIGRWYWNFKEDFVLGLVNENHQNVLDIGCGEGITLEKFIRRYPGKNIKGIDIVPENIKICRQFNLPAYLGSAYDLKIDSSSLDLCILSEVIEHFEDPVLALKNIYRVLKPGGDVIIIFPNDRFFKFARLLFLKFKEAFADVGHVNRFNPKILKQIIEEQGFRILNKKNIPFLFWPISLHCVFVARKN